ncbi:hypothetical protein [Nonomuraea sp. bgisy101]|uniref:hypothetical protein n=1 Tax=Nonomuraea sp. bgisy101 TaxID=3413784 RepID=UPI003D7254FE
MARSAVRASILTAVLAAGACAGPPSAGRLPARSDGSLSSAATTTSSGAPAGVISPEAVPAAHLTAIPARPASCPQPPAERDDLSPRPTASSWKRISTDEATGSMDDLAAAPDGTLWASSTRQKAAGQGVLEYTDGGLRRWDGTAWTAMPLPSGPDVRVVALAAASKERAWALGIVGRTGHVAAFDGAGWRVEPLSGAAAESIGWGGTAAESIAPGRLWAVNGRVGLLDAGGAWRSYALPSPASAVDGEGGELWAAGGTAALRWEGTGWRQVGVPALGVPAKAQAPRVSLTDVVVLGPREVWVVGGVSWLVPGAYNEENEPLELTRPVALRWDGSSWRCGWGAVGTMLTEAESDGTGGLWALDSTRSRLWHLSDGEWTTESPPVPGGRVPELTALARRPGSAEVYAVGAFAPEGADHPTFAALWRTARR